MYYLSHELYHEHYLGPAFTSWGEKKKSFGERSLAKSYNTFKTPSFSGYQEKPVISAESVTVSDSLRQQVCISAGSLLCLAQFLQQHQGNNIICGESLSQAILICMCTPSKLHTPPGMMQ